MRKQRLIWGFLVLTLPGTAHECGAVELMSTGDDAIDLAAFIVDEASGITVVPGSASTIITVPEGGTAFSPSTARGKFQNGITSAGTPLPPENQIPNGPTATYAGGVGMLSGVCLSTGWVTNFATPPAGRGFGIEGPNNGDHDGGVPANHEGEASRRFEFPRDLDFLNFAFPTEDPKPLGGDANVLEFQITTTSPGFLRISFVFASDEFPAWVDPVSFPFNDSFIMLVDGKNIATLTKNSVVSPFNLFDASECPAVFFRRNNTAPWPAELSDSDNLHDIPGAPRYDHEYGGFTKILTRETQAPLAPGTYMIKIAVQDVGEFVFQGTTFADHNVDTSLFIGEEGLKLFTLARADYNGDGLTNQSDWEVWSTNHGKTPATFYDGDGNGNGIVDAADYTIWRDTLGGTGNKDFCADFNRDGQVNAADATIMSPFYEVLTECASRFEGDANGDGAVDSCDLDIWGNENANSTPSRPCECVGGGESAMTSESSVDPAVLKQHLPESPDVDGDGDVDESDIAAINAIIAELGGAESSSAEAEQSPIPHEPTPTLAEPEPFNPAEHGPPLPPGAQSR